MSKIKDVMIDVIEKLESGTNPDDIAYYVSHTYDIPYDYAVMKLVEQIRASMNHINECVEEFPQVF